ncbi:MAG TPA: AbrB/MazE/SpoVT family DNA-binding domain-containing protein [Vicinamibacteria bacterium]|nr:AbrB/MazE/SpoVT family DNA-binding domain-containing protein [Vicinamibacteria bacterium]
MARVTSKLQVTIPKAVADRYGIEPGADIEFEPAGDVIRVVPARRPLRPPRDRVKLFERMLARQRERDAGHALPQGEDRGWTRDDLYDRARAR